MAFLYAGCSSPPPDLHSEYEQRYVRPLVSPGTQFAELPVAVQHTVRAEAGSASIARVQKGTKDSLTIYRISFQNAELFPPLYVASDGSVLDPNLNVAVGAPRDVFSVASHGPVARVSPDDLPPQVMKVIQRLAPEAEVDVITREQRGIQTVYVVTFKGRVHQSITIGSEGNVVP